MYAADDEEEDQESSKSNNDDDNGHADKVEESSDEEVNSSSPRGKEIADYYADFDDGQKFDEDEYETTFIKPGMHYGDNVEIVEQVTTIGCSVCEIFAFNKLYCDLETGVGGHSK